MQLQKTLKVGAIALALAKIQDLPGGKAPCKVIVVKG